MTAGLSEGSWLDSFQIYFNTVNHMFIALVTGYTTWLATQLGPGHVMYYHTLLTTLGYQLLMCESIVSLYKHNSWTGQHNRRTNHNIHWILQAAGSGLAVAGMVVIFVYKTDHFRNTHAQLGLASLVFTLLGVLNGTSALWARELRSCMKPLWLKLGHNLIGTTAFVLGMVALITGMDLFPFRDLSPSQDVITAMQVMCGITILLSLSGGVQSMWSQLRGVFENCCASRWQDDGEDSLPDFEPRKGNA